MINSLCLKVEVIAEMDDALVDKIVRKNMVHRAVVGRKTLTMVCK